MRLHVDGRNVRTIRMYAEAQAVADTGADTLVVSKTLTGVKKSERILPRKYVVDDSLAGIEFVTAIEGVK